MISERAFPMPCSSNFCQAKCRPVPVRAAPAAQPASAWTSFFARPSKLLPIANAPCAAAVSMKAAVMAVLSPSSTEPPLMAGLISVRATPACRFCPSWRVHVCAPALTLGWPLAVEVHPGQDAAGCHGGQQVFDVVAAAQLTEGFAQVALVVDQACRPPDQGWRL
jgi:hypothetical protein